VLMKPDQIRFVEVKSASGRLSKIQTYRHAELEMLGFNVETIKPCSADGSS
jgi:hypothetical protein